MYTEVTNAFKAWYKTRHDSQDIFDTWREGTIENFPLLKGKNYTPSYKWEAWYNDMFVEKYSSACKHSNRFTDQLYDKISFMVFNYYIDGKKYFFLYLLKYFDSNDVDRLVEFKKLPIPQFKQPITITSKVHIHYPHGFKIIRGRKSVDKRIIKKNSSKNTKRISKGNAVKTTNICEIVPTYSKITTFNKKSITRKSPKKFSTNNVVSTQPVTEPVTESVTTPEYTDHSPSLFELHDIFIADFEYDPFGFYQSNDSCVFY
mgnify:CR=1 FL=1